MITVDNVTKEQLMKMSYKDKMFWGGVETYVDIEMFYIDKIKHPGDDFAPSWADPSEVEKKFCIKIAMNGEEAGAGPSYDSFDSVEDAISKCAECFMDAYDNWEEDDDECWDEDYSEDDDSDEN